MTTYLEALRTIMERTDFELGNRPPYAERVWRLSRVDELLQQIGNPHRKFRSVHIAGTKGKGSTTAMIDSILRQAGYRTGMYTSPHLHTFRERIRVDGIPIPEEDVIRWVERLRPMLRTRPEVTVFEIITALGMGYFVEQGVDFGVFEVGLGGRLDATNVLHPLVSVITSISKDHTKVLGDTLESIAREKAGIIKPGVPVVVSPQRPAALRVIEEVAAERHAPMTLVGQDWTWHPLDHDLKGQRLEIVRAGRNGAPTYPRMHLPLLGAHQMENACAAVAAVEVLRDLGAQIDRHAVRQGLARVEWPGRMEVLGEHPLVMVDGAHNPYSAQCLLEAVHTYLQYRRIALVFGASRTHQPKKMLEILLPDAAKAYMTQAHHPRAVPAEELGTMAEQLGHKATVFETVSQALLKAMDESDKEDLVLVTGSLFVVAEAREAWAAANDWPPLPSDPPGAY